MGVQPRYFCLRGFMKSGTNWICRLLNLHPDVDCIGEFHWEYYFDAMQKNLAGLAPQRRDLVRKVVRRELESMVKRSLQQFAKPGIRLIGDRTPSRIHPIVIRDAPHICIIRDCRDVVVSRMFHLYNVPRVTQVFENFDDMRQRFEKFQNDRWYFRDHPDELLANETIVRHSARDWAQFIMDDRNTIEKQPQLRVLKVYYEHVHRDPNSELDKMLDFLKIDSADREPIPDVLTPGHQQEDPQGPNRKGLVGDWHSYMTPNAQKWIHDEAGKVLIDEGYVTSEDWS